MLGGDSMRRMKRLSYSVGDKVGQLTITGEKKVWSSKSLRYRKYYECVCSCGNKCQVRADLIGKQIVSCGCVGKNMWRTCFNGFAPLKSLIKRTLDNKSEKYGTECKCSILYADDKVSITVISKEGRIIDYVEI